MAVRPPVMPPVPRGSNAAASRRPVPVIVGLAIVAVVAYGALVAVLWLLQARFIFFPQTGRDAASTPAAHGVAYEDVEIATSDGEKLHAWWIPAERARGTVLLL